jgi:GNAT superfamily N-acetyltransferase
LLAALYEQRIAGYLLYDLPRDEIRVVHLVVARQYQGQGLARIMVDTIAHEHADRRGILLHCRNDFPADGLWPKLDFLPLGERTGRSIEGKPLTRWFRSFGRPDLFTVLHEHARRRLPSPHARRSSDCRPKASSASRRSAARTGRPAPRAYHWKAVRSAAGWSGSLYLATRHFAGWYMVNVLELLSEDVAIALGHTDGGELVRKLYGHRDHERALDRVTAAYGRTASHAQMRLV